MTDRRRTKERGRTEGQGARLVRLEYGTTFVSTQLGRHECQLVVGRWAGWGLEGLARRLLYPVCSNRRFIEYVKVMLAIDRENN